MSGEESKQENMTTLAVAVGRVEMLTMGISQQFSEFKANHKEDINFIWAEVDSLRNRITGLENINLEKKSGWGSLRLAIEVLAAVIAFVVGCYFSCHMGNICK